MLNSISAPVIGTAALMVHPLADLKEAFFRFDRHFISPVVGNRTFTPLRLAINSYPLYHMDTGFIVEAFKLTGMPKLSNRFCGGLNS